MLSETYMKDIPMLGYKVCTINLEMRGECKMNKYVRPFFLVLFNNVFLYIFLSMLKDYKHWGIALTLIIGCFWFVLFCMLVVAVRYTELPRKAK